MGFGAVTSIALSVPPRMQQFKRSPKHRKPSRQHVAFGIHTQIAVGPLGFGVTLDSDSPDGVSRPIEIQQSMGLILL